MAYKFNGGMGAVICDDCSVMFDAGLTPEEYSDIYCRENNENYCWRCYGKRFKTEEREHGAQLVSKTRPTSSG